MLGNAEWGVATVGSTPSGTLLGINQFERQGSPFTCQLDLVVWVGLVVVLLAVAICRDGSGLHVIFPQELL
jgi:hypothetical protein